MSNWADNNDVRGQYCEIAGRSIRRLGLIVGGSGFIGGSIIHYFKTQQKNSFSVLAPNSKRLSLREPEDIKAYLQSCHPDFIVNCAISPLDGGPQLTYEVNYLGSINLAKAASVLNIPYIHFSSAAVLPMGEQLVEEQTQPLSTDLPFYPRSKLMAEKTLQHLHETQGLDYTVIRPGVVYGRHDHKIQGFQRLLFSIAAQSMLFLFTRVGVKHSYTNMEKIPPFVHHVLENREEYSGQTYHFVDPEAVELDQLILSIRSQLGVKRPKKIHVPYPFARMGSSGLKFLLHLLRPLGFDGRLPQELMFLDKFYKTQVLSVEKLRRSSYTIPQPEVTIYTDLPNILSYYIARWQNFNLIPPVDENLVVSSPGTKAFQKDPESLLSGLHNGEYNYLANHDLLREDRGGD